MPRSDQPFVAYSPAALSDLQDLSVFLIEEMGNEPASKFIRRLRDRCESLSYMPRRFPAAEPNLHRATWESWSIYYRAGDVVEIVRILHHRRHIDPDMLKA